MDAHCEIPIKQSYTDALQKDGLCIFRGLMNNEHLNIIANEIKKIRQIVMAKVIGMERPLRPYSDISERYLGRFDYRCGFTSSIFNVIAEPIAKLVQEMSPEVNFRYFWGAIPSLAGAGPTNLHRDVYPMLKRTTSVNLDALDISMPPYYFTVFIPLVEITKENGPTEFVKGSHLVPIVDEEKAEIFAPLLSIGDVIIFDGRTLHRGSTNNSKNERLIAYITFVADWYHDQTFAINDYLFPELSLPGR